MPENTTTIRPFLDVILEQAGNPALPEGYDTWGFKIVRPDLRSYGGFRWPWPGGAVEDPAAQPSDDPCPTSRTGGYCVALSLAGAAAGGHGHATILLLAYRQADVLADDGHDKRRVRAAYVADVIDGRLVYRKARYADLQRADLRYADLQRANLQHANLRDADLQRADLERADLQRADLQHANLRYANLWYADLRDADLRDADLRYADLRHADLRDADLRYADLDAALDAGDVTRGGR
jgi:hypothetical protein